MEKTIPLPAPPRKREMAVIDAAAQVFARKGYVSALTKDIADHLSIRQASVYYYFKSKEEALEKVCKIGMEGYLDAIVRTAGSSLKASEKVRQMIVNHMRPMSERYAYSKVFLSERRHLPEASRKAISEMALTYESILKGIFEEGVATGEFSADLDCASVARGTLGMCNSAINWYRPGKDVSIDTIAQTYARIILEGSITRA